MKSIFRAIRRMFSRVGSPFAQRLTFQDEEFTIEVWDPCVLVMPSGFVLVFKNGLLRKKLFDQSRRDVAEIIQRELWFPEENSENSPDSA